MCHKYRPNPQKFFYNFGIPRDKFGVVGRLSFGKVHLQISFGQPAYRFSLGTVFTLVYPIPARTTMFPAESHKRNFNS